MKRGIVFIFSLFFISFSLFSCSSSSENTSSGGIKHVYEDDTNARITGITIPSNYIELVKEDGVDLHYNISAFAEPRTAENKALHYTSSNPKIAEVATDGIVTIKDFGSFDVSVSSDAAADIQQKVDFFIRENTTTSLDIKNDPLSVFGSYSIIQYGIDSEPNTNVGGSLSINVYKASESADIHLLFNGLELPLNVTVEDLANMSYEDAGKSIFSYFNGKIKDNTTMVIQLKADDNPSLIENSIVSSGQILFLSLKKDYDLVPNQNMAEENYISVTNIQVAEKVELDRLINPSQILSPIVLPVNATNKAITYKSSNEKVVKVSPIGEIRGISAGEAVITVTSVSNGDVISKTNVKVKDSTIRVEKIVFDNIDTNIYMDTPVTVKAKALPENATYRDIAYYSKNPSIATVNSATGQVIPRRKGSVEIVAVSDKGSAENAINLNISVHEPVSPVLAILNVPSKINMSLENGYPIELNAKVFPTYADDTNILYNTDENSCITVDDNGKITAKKVGTSTVTVSSAKYPDIKKDIEVNVRQEEKEIYVTSINLNETPSTLYIGKTEHIVIPELVPANANIDHNITYSVDDESIVNVEQINGEKQYKIIPKKEGSAIITLKTANGVENEIHINVKKVMDIKGYYTIDKVAYTLADKTEIFTPDNDKLQGEFAIDLLDDKYTVQGRLQYTPANPFASYTFNNWRYIYENKEIMLNEMDKYANQTKSALLSENIKVTGQYTLEYTYTQDSFKAVVYLTKVNNEVKEILDRTMYMTPVDMAKDPHSAEGYYEMTWFYGNSFNNKWLERYPAIYSNSQDDMPISSNIGTTYHKGCPNIGGWAACYSGGGGANGSVTNYKGAFAVKVDGTTENAQLSSIMKVQTQGHQNYNIQTWAKYIHSTFDPSAILQNVSHTGIITNTSLNASVETYKSSEGSKGASISYTQMQDNMMQFEVFLNLSSYEYRFMYRAVKVSDRYIDLPTDKFVSGDVSDRIPPEVPELALISPVEDFTGTVTPIE